jgi:DNA-directed RNA polymerase subunit L
LCMIVKVLELEKDKVRLIIQGEGHTFMNALVEEILSDPDVDVARYMIEFQFSDPELLVTTKSKKNPLPIIKKACQRISDHCDSLVKGIKKVKA